MKKPRLRLLVLLLGLSVLVLFVTRWPRGEPVYEGRTLEEWVVRYYPFVRVGDSRISEDDAIQHFGTNALPNLLKWVQYEPPAPSKLRQAFETLRRTLKLDRRLVLDPDEGEIRAQGAARAFAALASQARGMTGELNRLLDVPWPSRIADRATYALAGLGDAGFTVLIARLKDDKTARRTEIARALGNLGTNARPILPVLLDWLKDNDGKLAECAASGVGNFGLEPALVVPALAEALLHTNRSVRLNAANSLGAFGKAARPVIPALIDVMNGPDPQLSKAARGSLGRIDAMALDWAQRIQREKAAVLRELHD